MQTKLQIYNFSFNKNIKKGFKEVLTCRIQKKDQITD